MRILRLASIRDWPDLAIEAQFRWRPIQPLERPISWDLPENVRRRVKVRWPAVYGDFGFTSLIVPALRRFIDVELVDRDTADDHTLVAEFHVNERRFDVAFDFADDPDFESDASVGSALTFKMQFRTSGYANERIVPGGYIPANLMVYRMLPWLRDERFRKKPLYQVSGRFGGDFAKDIRSAAVQSLTSADEFDYWGGIGRVRYSKFLREVARSRVSVDMPGNGPFCFRFVEYLSVGACIVAFPHDARLPEPLIDGHHLLYSNRDLSDLVEKCDWCLRYPAEARRLSSAAADYFDRYLHREQLAAYYIRTLLDRAI